MFNCSSIKNSLRTLAFCTALTATSAWAGINAAKGVYLGLDATGAGYATPQGTALNSEPLFGQFFLRPYIGYRFNDYIAVESAYDDIVHDSDRATGPNPSDYGPDHYRLYAVDFAGKLIYPFPIGISVFVKGGVAYVHQSVFNQVFNDSAPLIDQTANEFRPLAGAGFSYNFTQKFSTNLNFTWIHGNATIGNIGMLGLGLAYTF